MADPSHLRDVMGFDGDLQMFRETPQPVNWEHLQFLRWLIQQGRLAHPACQPAGGEGSEAETPDGAYAAGRA